MSKLTIFERAHLGRWIRQNYFSIHAGKQFDKMVIYIESLPFEESQVWLDRGWPALAKHLENEHPSTKQPGQ